jgi:hypothetical protein
MKNLNCRKAEEWIVADLDEGLDHEKRLILEDHLRGCASCGKMREDTALLLSEVAADAPEDPGEAFWKLYRISLDARLRERDISRSWGPWRLRAWGFGWKPASALAMAILVFVIISVGIFHLWGFRPSTDQAVSPQLIGELNELYGPVSDELPYFAFTSGDTQFLQASRSSVLDDSSVEWFEVEDEPNQLFL